MSLALTSIYFTLLSIVTCPFCTAPEPTLAERRETVDWVAIAEAGESLPPVTGKPALQRFTVHRVLKGDPLPLKPPMITIPAKVASGNLALLFATRNEEPGLSATFEDQFSWQATAVDETSLAYFVKAPDLRVPTAERLPYFVRFLEHANATIAADAYSEFGRAPFDAVTKVAGDLPMDIFRKRLIDPEVPGERKGFYGLALGLARSEVDKKANAAALRGVIEQPASDFRAGFDGVLGGLLVLEGTQGLDLLDRRILGNPAAARGDVLHAVTALRFYYEYGTVIPKPRLAVSMARLLARPDCAAVATIDLARWQAWDQLPQVEKLWPEAKDDRQLQRAIIGFLLACPTPEARTRLATIRRDQPEVVAEMEKGSLGLGLGR